jgi:hypothetical protein
MDGSEEAIWQLLTTRANPAGEVEISTRNIGYITGLPKSSVQRILLKFRQEGILLLIRERNGNEPPAYAFPKRACGPTVAQTVTQTQPDDFGNAVPTMPFQLPVPSGQAGSWWSQAFQAITRARSNPRADPICRVCWDVGLYVDRTSVAYSHDWLKSCSCEASQPLPGDPDFVPERSIGMCPMCENTGWVDVGTEVQRCHSCRRTYA